MVEFFDGTTELGTANLSGGVASLTTSSFSSGTNSITAQYLGDGNFSGSPSPAISQTVNLGGEVFNDVNGNGVLDPGDSGLLGWTINAVNSGNQIVASATTDSNGDYSLIGVGPGTFSIEEVVPSGYVATTPSSIAVTTTGGPSPSVVNFGDFQTVTYSGEVYNDVTGNGTFGGADTGLGGWTVNLYSGSTLIAHATTAGERVVLVLGHRTRQLYDPGGHAQRLDHHPADLADLVQRNGHER